ncbi:lipopolysaccharide biosynthesis protein [Komagataeibacter swingsii]|uniref:Polysaccharide biosynthesis protein n=1 Tax=Komagataeibacter swingsii TaxID=215220 RepID=A0A2V4RKF1_9PROT|nr:hypothetical protein [Komagataeibacter swingsii]PYD69484.1 hypothetical protein CFR76_09125 [Komagataeibacter swingsii]GBQ59571.1 hypothetical protein AA16373_1614 [Komagataeibacter swingsii DSM 16373]
MNFLLSFAEQAFGSLLTFFINMWMARNGAQTAYGVYAFWLAIAWILGSAQATLVTSHLLTIPHKDGPERTQVERLFLSVQILFLLLTMAGIYGLSCGMRAYGSPFYASAAAVFIPSFLLFQYVRAFAFSRQRTRLAMFLTGGILLLAVCLLGADHAAGHPVTVDRSLLLTALAYGGVSTGMLLYLAGGMTPLWRWAAIRPNLHYLHSSGWLLLGAGSAELINRLYSFVVAGWYGTAALALLTAVQVAIRPAWMLSAAWMSVGLPRLSQMWDRGEAHRIVRMTTLGTLGCAAGSMIWSFMVIGGWHWIAHTLYHDRYDSVGIVPYLWMGNVMLGGAVTALNCTMLAMRKYRILALVDLGGAVVTCMAMGGVIVAHLSFPWVVSATMAGQLAQCLLMLPLALRALGVATAPARAPHTDGRAGN